jgi:hypothetical protein
MDGNAAPTLNDLIAQLAVTPTWQSRKIRLESSDVLLVFYCEGVFYDWAPISVS